MFKISCEKLIFRVTVLVGLIILSITVNCCECNILKLHNCFSQLFCENTEATIRVLLTLLGTIITLCIFIKQSSLIQLQISKSDLNEIIGGQRELKSNFASSLRTICNIESFKELITIIKEERKSTNDSFRAYKNVMDSRLSSIDWEEYFSFVHLACNAINDSQLLRKNQSIRKYSALFSQQELLLLFLHANSKYVIKNRREPNGEDIFWMAIQKSQILNGLWYSSLLDEKDANEMPFVKFYKQPEARTEKQKKINIKLRKINENISTPNSTIKEFFKSYFAKENTPTIILDLMILIFFSIFCAMLINNC